MVKKYIIFLNFISVIFAQISLGDINKEIDSIKEELKAGVLEPDVLDVAPIPTVDFEPVAVKAPTSLEDDEYFGYNYFKRDISFFDNIPTPADFRLGPGDEIILSLWGENNSRDNFVINKEGLIYYENIGFINLSNKTLKEAEAILVRELSDIYETLTNKDNPTKLMLELGKLKSLNVYFTGQIEKPGISLIHPFSDLFSAIVQGGGVQKNGSLRNIQLIRNGKVINTVDFYSFFVSGKDNFSKIKILDGDVIHIPTITRRVNITGTVYKSGYYELFNDESVLDLINYTGGLTANASSFAIIDILIPMLERSSDDNAKVSKNINLSQFADWKLNNGDIVNILPITRVDTKVRIIGRVKAPGLYGSNLKLKDVLNLAGGFDDPLYRQTIRDDEIVILRKDNNQFYSLEYKVSYDKSDEFELTSGDQIFVYENSLYDNRFTISVEGEVNRRGTYQLKKGMTVEDAIGLAEGFTELANQDAITVTEVFTTVDDLGEETEEIRQVSDVSLYFELTLSNGSVINVLPMENVISVEGNVYNPGLITYTGRKSIKKYLEIAGGIKKDSIVNDIYVKRANGKIRAISRLNRLYVSAQPGDTIVVPVDETPRDDFNITAFIADFATALANIAAILVIVDNANDD